MTKTKVDPFYLGHASVARYSVQHKIR